MRAHSPPGSALEAEYRTHSEMQEEIHLKEDFLKYKMNYKFLLCLHYCKYDQMM